MAQATIAIQLKAIDNFSKTFNKMGSSFAKQADKMKSVGKKMSMFLTLPILGFGALAVKEAAMAEGAVNKFRAVFKDQSDDMMRFVDDIRREMPSARHEIIRMAADLQDLLVPMGIAREEATGMAQGFLVLSNQIAAFNDVSPEQVLNAIKSGLVGSSEPLKAYGVDARITTLEITAMNAGLLQQGETFADLEPATRAQITAQALLIQITNQSSDAIEGFEENNKGALRSMQNAKASIQELQVVLGKVLLPTVGDAADKISEMVKKFNAIPESLQKSIVFFGLFIAVLGPVAFARGTTITMITKMRAAILLLRTSTAILALVNLTAWGLIPLIIIAAIGVIVVGFILLNKHADAIRKKLASIALAVKNFFLSVVSSLKEGVMSMINFMIFQLNGFIRVVNRVIAQMNRIPTINIPMIAEIPNIQDIIGRMRPSNIPVPGVHGPIQPPSLMFGPTRPVPVTGPIINITGTFMSEDAAEKMGNLLLEKLKTQFRF